MVLMNGSKKARYQKSIENQFNGGGNKKAGLVPTQTTSSSTHVCYTNRHLPKPMSVMQIPLVSTVKPSRPIGFRNIGWH